MDDDFDDADFDCLRADKTSWLTLSEVHIPTGNPEPVILELRFIGEGNEDAERLRNNRAFRELSKTDAEAAGTELIAKTAIVSWRNVSNKDGTPKACTVERRIQLLDQLRRVKRSGLIDRIVGYASNASNFTTPVIDAGDLGKA